ncbi:MAG: accessory gene regulator B family protein [Eubacterium sp.]|jgi:accessory gene regulator B|nr:accessory gene regulator B family protein [Eubacterium sp.]
MFNEISKRVTLWLKRHGAVQTELQDVYEYAIFNILHIAIPIMIVLCMGIAMNMLPEALFLYLPFYFMRKYSGGYHMKTAARCLIGTSVILLGCLLIADHLSTYVFYYVLVAVSVVSLIIHSPIDSNNRRLTDEEKRYCHRRATYLAVLSEAIFIILVMWEKNRISNFWGMGIIMTASLQLPVIVTNRFCKNNDQKRQED